jgi:hypothetical protein
VPRSPVLVLVVGLALLQSACGSNRFKGPTFVAALGAMAAGSGVALMAVGDRENLSPLEQGGAIALVSGVGLIVLAGVWLSIQNQCDTDSDCAERESCQELVTPAGRMAQCVGG